MNRENEVSAPTFRFIRGRGKGWVASGRSANCGLECYLGEAAVRFGNPAKARIQKAVERLTSECRELDGRLVWGWELNPSIPGVTFPADWDDTAKAVDFLKAAEVVFPGMTDGALPGPLPEEDFWQSFLSSSFFVSREIGQDVILFMPNASIGLSVFFGRGSERIAPREDLMVVACVLRTTGLHFPRTLKALEARLIELARRCCRALKVVLANRIPFERISRYYFSEGHFAYRLIEGVEACRWQFDEVGFPLADVEQRCRNASRRLSKATKAEGEEAATTGFGDWRLEENWWTMVGHCLGLEGMVKHEDSEVASPVGSPELVFRHRRLEHYYGSPSWTVRLQRWESMADKRSLTTRGDYGSVGLCCKARGEAESQ